LKKKILILYITTLSGHYKAAKAIEKALKIKDQNCEITSLDILSYLHPYSSKLVNFLYSLMIKKLPFFWGSIYDKEKLVKGIEPFKKGLYHHDLRKIEDLIIKERPQAVVCTQAFPCGLVAYLKEKKCRKFPLIGVVTDFWPNSFWFSPEVDYYVIAFDWVKKRFKEAGIKESAVRTLGLPIMPDFNKEFDKKKLSLELGLSPELPTILVMGGGSGLGPLERIAEILDNSKLEFQLIIVCGKNKKLYNLLLSKKFNKSVKIFPYTENIPEFMSFSDIIITKPGGITIAESLAKGLAIIVFKPIPGQEEKNLKFLVRENLVFNAKKLREILYIVERLFLDKEDLRRVQRRAHSFSQPESSLRIADLVLESINGELFFIQNS